MPISILKYLLINMLILVSFVFTRSVIMWLCHLQGQVTPASGPSPIAIASLAMSAASSSTPLNQPPPLLRPSLPATPALHRQPPPLQQQARFLQPRSALNQPPPLIRPSNPLPPRLNPRPAAPTNTGMGPQPPTLVGIPSENPSSSLH